MDRNKTLLLILVLLLTAVVTGCGVLGGESDISGLATASPTERPTAEAVVTAALTSTPVDEAETLPTATDDAAATEDTEPTAQPESPQAPAGEVDFNQLNVALDEVAGGLKAPIGLGAPNDGSGRFFVLEKCGTIRILDDGQVLNTPFLDISDRVRCSGSEQGLLGIAFHPNYAENGYFFLNYSDSSGDTNVSRFTVTDDPNVADPSSEQIVLEQSQPAGNHNGGHLVFGPDGYLWIGMGDGGRAGDVFGNGQNLGSWLGAMLRINVDELPYTVPEDNPYTGSDSGLDEIWAFGLRNPWRYSFDRQTGDLYIADVGQNIYEEVNVQSYTTPALNYGWPIMEGLHCFGTDSCDESGLVLPVIEYDHSEGCSVTGGYVYRGEQFPVMQGVYFFGDYCSGRLWGTVNTAEGWQVRQLLHPNMNIATFGEDEAGEIYLTDMSGGSVYHLTAE